MSGPDDKAALIVAIARTGDRAAFSNLFMFFAPRVKSYLLRLGMGNGEAEDLAQETLLTVWRKAASFDPERAGASTWIFTIARNLRLDAARQAWELVPDYRGVMLWDTGTATPLPNRLLLGDDLPEGVTVLPPLTIGEAEVSAALDKLEAACTAMETRGRRAAE